MKHVMLDLETMGNNTGSAIIAIGAVMFDKDEVLDRFEVLVDLESSVNEGLVMDPSTVMWWMQQSEEARAQFTGTSRHLDVALTKFHGWIESVAYTDSVQMWGNGAAFDNAILSNAYRQTGLTQPWKFWNDRCYRTIKNLFNVPMPGRVGVYHNAADDAATQALHLIAIGQHIEDRGGDKILA